MKKWCLFILLLCCSLQLGLPVGRIASPGQEPVAQEFPSELLQGKEEFSIAIDLQGDIRGNVGPCG